MATMQRLIGLTIGLSLITAAMPIAPIPAVVAATPAPSMRLKSLLDQAERYRQRQQFKRAITIYRQGLPLLPKASNWKLKSRLLFRLGNSYRRDQQYGQAIPYLKQALDIYQANNHLFSEAYTLRSIGLSYRSEGNYDAALKYLKQAQTAFFKQTDRFWQLNSLYDLGNIYAQRQEHHLTVSTFQQALAINRSVKQVNYQGELLYKIAIAQHRLKQFDAAIANYKASIPITQFDRYKIGAHFYLGKIYYDRAEYQTTIRYLNEGLKLARRTKHQDKQLQLLYDLGTTYNRLGNPQKAAPLLRKSLQLAQTLQAKGYEQSSLQALGNMLRQRGQYAESIAYTTQSLQLAQQLQRPNGIQGSRISLGLAHYYLGDYKQAERYYLQVLHDAKAQQNLAMEGRVHGNLGLLYRQTNNRSKALQHSQQSLRIARQLNDSTEVASTLLDLGLLYDQFGQIDQAITHYLTALDIAQTIEHKVLSGRLYGNLGMIYRRQGDLGKAQQFMRSSIAIAQQTGDRREQGVGLSNLGLILLDAKQYAAAEQSLRSSIRLWEQQRAELNRHDQYNTVDRQKITLFERQAHSYRHLQMALVKQHKATAALAVAEQARTHALVDLMARKQSGSAVALGEQPDINIQQLKQIARDQQATIVEYSLISQTNLLIWVIQPNGQVNLRQVNPTIADQGDLKTITRNTRNAIGVRSRRQPRQPNRGSTSIASPTQSLHSILIQPIADLLPRDPAQHVVFIPHQSLFTVSFAALKDAQGKYLIDQHTIRTAPSIQVLGLTQRSANQGSSSSATRNQSLFEQALIVGNPQMPTIVTRNNQGEYRETLQSLPYAETEAKQIAKLINSQPLIGDQATKDVVVQRMRQAKLIHLATHGLLDDFQDLGIPGAIALAPNGTGQPNDGILTTDELTNTQFPLQAELVVLSACDTGQGNITGDGVIGLSRSFLAAGVPSLVVSLWAVDDQSTTVLMTEFYRQLKTTPDRAAALRQAMLKTREKYPNPYDWAAFSLVGQP
ncbi:CHAT domain-containing protein [filamentous cyanobacterium LEGE 11480]|uniref:CHAT domain-containing protein n=1 Tax=Romeriopsis navalis LEGE 11480 TaxID=2777977 RepID=A0A928VP17_9CYAN|nr:CHAT domain-containing protein [Romeriopsis navalis]MBE9029932.1 CHAT domain-containing protein [Romeriopsis navalis LEGE 11480]